MTMAVAGSVTDEHIYGPTGPVATLSAPLNTNGTLYQAYIPLPGGAQAVYNTTGLLFYNHVDWLGTSRLATTPSRTVNFDQAYAPYGESYESNISPSDPPLEFAGLFKHTGTGYFDTPNREYHPVQGRWISPDPAGLGAVDMSDPQSWNRYAYVGNMPLNLTGRLGLRVGMGADIAPYDSERAHTDAFFSGYELLVVATPEDKPTGDSQAFGVSPDGAVDIGNFGGYADTGEYPVTSTVWSYSYSWVLDPGAYFDAYYIRLRQKHAPTTDEYLKAIHDTFAKFPDLCNGSVGVTGRAGNGAVSINTDRTSPSFEVGPVSVASPSDISLNVGETLGGTVGFNPENHTVTSVGLFAGVKAGFFELSAHVDAAVTNLYQCP